MILYGLIFMVVNEIHNISRLQQSHPEYNFLGVSYQKKIFELFLVDFDRTRRDERAYKGHSSFSLDSCLELVHNQAWKYDFGSTCPIRGF